MNNFYEDFDGHQQLLSFTCQVKFISVYFFININFQGGEYVGKLVTENTHKNIGRHLKCNEQQLKTEGIKPVAIVF